MELFLRVFFIHYESPSEYLSQLYGKLKEGSKEAKWVDHLIYSWDWGRQPPAKLEMKQSDLPAEMKLVETSLDKEKGRLLVNSKQVVHTLRVLTLTPLIYFLCYFGISKILWA